MLWAAMVVMLGAAEAAPVEVTQSVESAREAARFRGSVSGVFSFGAAIGYGAGGLGPGVGFELGVELKDRWAVMLRSTIATVLLAAVSTLGVAADHALSDHWGLGFGLAAAYIGGMAADIPVSVSVALPLRVTFSPHARSGVAVARRGLQVFFELVPGVEVAGARGFGASLAATRPPISAAGTVGIGYGVW